MDANLIPLAVALTSFLLGVACLSFILVTLFFNKIFNKLDKLNVKHDDIERRTSRSERRLDRVERIVSIDPDETLVLKNNLF